MRFSYTWLVIFFVLTILGVIVLPRLGVRQSAVVEYPSISVSCSWPGATAEAAERLITSKIEGALNTIGGIEKISSLTRKGSVSVTIKFDQYTVIEQIRLEVSMLIRQIYPNLPEGCSYPVITTNTPSRQIHAKPLLTYTLTAPETPGQIQENADKYFKGKLSAVKGVDKIDIYGGVDSYIRIEYNSDLMHFLGIYESDIKEALTNAIQRIDVGDLSDSSKSGEQMSSYLFVDNSKKYLGFENIPLKLSGDRIVYFRDIARITKNEEIPGNFYRINGENAVYLVIYPDDDENNLQLASVLKEEINKIITGLPAGYKLILLQDSTEYITARLENIYYRTLLTVFILLVFVMLVYRNVRYTAALLVSLVVNLGISFFIYFLLGLELHLYSLAGITISLGIIIDNMIIMSDHLMRYRNKKVFIVILASTATTLAALSVIYLLPVEIRLDLWDFATVIFTNLIVSVFVALFFIPAYLSRFQVIQLSRNNNNYRRKRLVIRGYKIYGGILLFLIKRKRSVIILALLSFGLPVFLLPVKLDGTNWYHTLYNQTLGSEVYQEKIRPLSDKLLGGALRLFTLYVFENSYYESQEQTTIYVNASVPEGYKITELDKVFHNLETIIGQFREVDLYITKINGIHNASVTITIKPEYEDTAFPFFLKNLLIRNSMNYDGMSWNISGAGKGFSSSHKYNEPVNYSVILKGYNYYDLVDQAERFSEKLMRNPRIRNINFDADNRWYYREKLYEYNLFADEYMLAFYGISLKDFHNVLLKSNNQGTWISSLITKQGFTPVMLVALESDENDLWHVMNTPTKYSGSIIKPNSLSECRKQSASTVIVKEDQQYIKRVEYNYLGKLKFGDKFLNEVIEEMRKEMPAGYNIESSKYQWQDKAKIHSSLLLVIFVIIYIICAVLFESLRHPFIILFTVPLSYIGIFLTYYLADISYDMGGFASFVLLSGLVLNSAIYLVNEFNMFAKDKRFIKRSATSLYIKAIDSKIIPVIITILSTVMGLLPFIFAGQNEHFWFSLGIGSIGGLLFSLVVILVYLPIMLIPKEEKKPGP